MLVENSIFSTNIPQIFFDGPLAGWWGFPMAQVLPPKNLNFLKKKCLDFSWFFFLKNSSPFFLKPWRVGTSNINILLIGAIKNYNFFYCHFLLRPFLSEIFIGPLHQAKAESSSRTVFPSLLLLTAAYTLTFIYAFFASCFAVRCFAFLGLT